MRRRNYIRIAELLLFLLFGLVKSFLRIPDPIVKKKSFVRNIVVSSQAANAAQSSSESENDRKKRTKLYASSTVIAPSQDRQVLRKKRAIYSGMLSAEFDEILSLPLLNAEEEIALGRRIRTLVEIETAQRQGIKGKEDLKKWNATNLAKAILSGREARNTLILSNMRLVVSLASRAYRQARPPMSNGVSRDGESTTLGDLVAEGVVGLATAVDRWDPERGFRFSTYATFWIRQAVRRSYQRSGIIIIPPNVQELARKAKQSAQELEEKLGRPPTSDEYAAQVGLSTKQLAIARRALDTVASIDLPASGRSQGHDDSAEPALALKFQADDPSPDVAVAFNELRHTLDDAMTSKLLPSERDVLRLRLGLDDGASRSRTEVGRISGLSRDRVRHLESSAIRKLRKYKSKFQGLESLAVDDLV